MEKEELIQTEKLEMEKPEEEKTPKINKTKKKEDWFLIGSFRRICMVLLSYILLLTFLCSSFLTVAYFYWFGTETANSYPETKRFQERIQSKIEDVVPPLRQYLQQDRLDSNEMVEIYTVTAEESKKGEVTNRWRKTKSYTCESGAEIAGFQTETRDREKGEWLYYEKQSDEFLLFRIIDNQLIDFTENHFIKRWEEYYYSRGHEGIQRYCAISSDTMKEWILKYGNFNGEEYYYHNLPDDICWIECSYHSNEDTLTILCYSKKKDRWYYLTGNDEYELEKKAFHMPSIVYFPLYSVEEPLENTSKGMKLSNGFNKASLYLNNGLLYQKSKPEKIINGESILKASPFFNLKTVLYEAGKEYYYQKMLLQYIDSEMDGYLWDFCFHSDLEDTSITIEENLSDNTMYYEEFFVDYDLDQEKNGIASILTGIGKQQGYYSVTVRLALPKYSINMANILSKTMPQEQELRYYLENMIFCFGYQKSGLWIGLAILSLVIYGIVLIRLLFGKREKKKFSESITLKEQVLKEKETTIILARFDYLPTEISIFIISVSASILIMIAHIVWDNSWSWFINVLCLFLSCTLIYFLCYILVASLIRRIRANILWKNFLIVKVIIWIWRKSRQCFGGIWKNSGWKRKTIMLLSGYLIGSIFFGAGSILSFIMMMDMGDGAFFITCIFLLLLFAGLQVKAISYVIKNEIGTEQILEGIKELSLGNLEYEINMQRLSGEYLEMAQTLPKIRDGLNTAIQKSLRDERMKTELITNVSHDIKTPLTSIINYVDLLKRAKPQGENVEHYLEVLTQKSERLRHLIEDLVEASKASSGTLLLDKKNLNLTELIQQVIGEFEEKLSLKKLLIVIHCPEIPVMIFADGQRMFRIMENLFQNLYKYTLEGTRVYLDLEIVDMDQKDTFDKSKEKKAVLTLRNISAAPLNISEEELTERFVRGEESRTTEGSGLGLSIARDLVKLQGGRFWLKIDGDLFKVMMEFPIVEISSNV